MTVCIAAISSYANGFVITGASDRMLTAADVEFEPEVPKLYPLTNSIVALLAGDSPTQAEVLQEVDLQVKALLKPDEWLDVKQVAELYAQAFNKRRTREAQTAILAPLGLDVNSFISRQREMDPSFIRMVATELYNYQPPETSAIITGMDNTGPHIFVVANGSIDCHDTIGFASIGIGAGHANSQLMFAGQNPGRAYPAALMQTFAAKKRAEVAPGVGEATDMFLIGTTLGSFRPIPANVIDALEKTYQTMRETIKTARDKAEGEIGDFFKKAVEQAQRERKKQSQPDSDGETSADSARVRPNSKKGERKDGGKTDETVH